MAGKITVSTINDSSGVLAAQNGMTGIAKAWVNFSATGGTISILASFNISSVVRISTGYYTINFTTAMPSANYSVNYNVPPAWGSSLVTTCIFTTSSSTQATPTASSFNVFVTQYNTGTTGYDTGYNCISVFSS